MYWLVVSVSSAVSPVAEACDPQPPADLILVGPTADAGLGAELTGAGDLDGDGFDELVVAATPLAPGAERVFVYAGGPAGPSSAATWELLGPDDPGIEGFGEAVAGVGDVDGDSYDDVAVAVGRFGEAWVFRGGPTGPSTSPDWVLEGYPYWWVEDVAGAGDLDGDGYDDILLGIGGEYEGTDGVWVFRGSASGPIGPTTLPNPGVYGLGSRVGGVGDLDGDGLPEVFASSGQGNKDAVLYPSADNLDFDTEFDAEVDHVEH